VLSIFDHTYMDENSP